MRRTKDDAELTRQALLKAALVVFSKQGYSDTRLEDIATEAGVTRGALYHHFGGKAELYTTLIAEANTRLAPVINLALSKSPSPVATLRNLLVDILTFAATDPHYRAVSELIAFKTAVTPELEAGMQTKLAGTRQLVDFLTQQVQAGIEQGEIRSEVKARDVALTLYALQNGILTLWLLDPSLFSLKERVAAMAELFFQGIVTERE